MALPDMPVSPTPAGIFREYERGVRYKNGLGAKGLYEQNRINERFFIGDQWRGVRVGGDRPLVRHNIIKRIADYKMAVVGAAPLTVTYTADGIPNTVDLRRRTEENRRQGAQGRLPDRLGPEEEISLITSALSDYYRVTAERLKFGALRDQALRNAYITGSGVLYTYWDDAIATGLYADAAPHRPHQRGHRL